MFALRVLGQVEGSRDGRPVHLGGPRPRLVLALLALEPGRVVSTEHLVDALWEAEPPATARAQVTIHISALRKAVGGDVIETVGAGYRLRSSEIDVDAAVAEELLAEARTHRDPDRLRQALAMWTGPVLAGLGSAAVAAAAQRLEDLRLTGLEDWALFELERGGHHRVLAELPQSVAENPLREGLRARLMSALWYAGRRAEALDVYHEGRRVLAEELGLDPGTELRELQERILREDTRPTTTGAARTDDSGFRPGRHHVTTPADAARPAGPRNDAVIPRQLPVSLGAFAGRTPQLEALDTLLGTPEPDDGYQVIALHGPGGAGKTTLAVHWAHRVKEQFPDGQLFLNLRGYGPNEPLDHMQALDAMLRSLGVHGDRIPASADQRSALLRSEMATKRMLVVLDNARESAHVRPLLPGGRNVVVATSRSQLRSLATRDGARRLAVNEMAPEESLALLRRRLGDRAGDDTVLTELADLCGHLPIALAITAERASRDDGRSLRQLTAQLRDRQAALDALTAWEGDPLTSVRAVLEWTYRTLNDETARMFRLVGLHVAPDLCLGAAAAMAGLDLESTARLLDPLIDFHLLNEEPGGCYEMHDLVRAYAAELVQMTESPAERDEAVGRLRRWYIHSVDNAHIAFDRPHGLITVGDAGPGLTPWEFVDAGEAFRRVADHLNGLTAVVRDAAQSGDHHTVVTLTPLMVTFLSARGGLQEAIELTELAMQSARLAGDAGAEAICACQLGQICGRKHCNEPALAYFTRARDLFAQADNHTGELLAMMNMGMVLDLLDRPDESIALLEETLHAARRLGLRVREAVTLNNLSNSYRRAGRLDDALAAAEESVHLHRESNHQYGQALALDTLASAHLGLGSPERARRCCLDALTIHAGLGESANAAIVWQNLGLAERALGRAARAHECFGQALDLLVRSHVPDTRFVSRDKLRRLIDEVNVTGGESKHPDPPGSPHDTAT